MCDDFDPWDNSVEGELDQMGRRALRAEGQVKDLRRQLAAANERAGRAESVIEKVKAFIGPNVRRGHAEALNELRDLIDRELSGGA